MTPYLLKTTLGLLVSIGFYQLWLDREQLPRLKRGYLLTTLLLVAIGPVLSLPVALPIYPVATSQPEIVLDLTRRLAPGVTPSPEGAPIPYGWWIYGFITTVLLARFVGRGYRLTRQISANANQPLGPATLVWLEEEALPYTFLNYLFVSKATYLQGKLEPELLTHEMAHIRQRHTLDVLLIELVLCLGWFNPLLYWYRRAIRLNHEFLADQAVNRIHNNVTGYQRLLVSKLSLARGLSLTSTLTFQLTKKRLLMMTKQTSGMRSRLTGAGVILVVGGLTIGLGTSVPAQVAPATKPANTTTAGPSSVNDAAKREQQFGDKLVLVPNPTSRVLERKKFSDLSAQEKQRVRPIPPLPRLVVTPALLKEWKNAQTYGIWVDDKRVSNARLTRYTAQDFGSYFSSKLEKNALNYGKHDYQIDLMTTAAYERYLTENERNPTLVLNPIYSPAR